VIGCSCNYFAHERTLCHPPKPSTSRWFLRGCNNTGTLPSSGRL
jgi:hypothetical protein